MLINSVNMAIDLRYLSPESRNFSIIRRNRIVGSLSGSAGFFAPAGRQEAATQSLLDWEKMNKKALKK